MLHNEALSRACVPETDVFRTIGAVPRSLDTFSGRSEYKSVRSREARVGITKSGRKRLERRSSLSLRRYPIMTICTIANVDHRITLSTLHTT